MHAPPSPSPSLRCSSALLVALLLLLLQLVSSALAVSGKNPCHGGKGGTGSGVTCTGVALPPQLCTKCKLKPFLSNGNFADCRSIYDLYDLECQQQLRQYAIANQHCDPVRYQQTQDFSNSYNVMQLDYFVYSLCEQCCDCVPRGASPDQYEDRNATGTLLSVYRGNCPAHAHYDICRVLPKIKYTTSLGDENAVTHEDWPTVCPLLKSWISSDAAKGWLWQSYVSMDGAIARFLEQLMVDATCGAEDAWLECAALEDAQGRL